MRHHRLVGTAALAAASLVLSLGCADEDLNFVLPPAASNVIGTFALSSIDGRMLPLIVFTSETEQWRLESDAISVAPDGSWRETSNYRVFAAGDTLALAKPLGLDTISVPRSLVVTGSYSIRDNQVDFRVLEGGTQGFEGTVTGNSLIILFRGRRYTYNR